ncbi:hypothetical protein [Lapillicoccus jejuensis]|uniref:Uncharacterized protein n=1 Tax=Lapillicoccus jejuensis TaxID=402171 RepID=A0A542E1J4_9MICO|nr:hypothetical protein [Lapillicoccus jejuensis]TQJ09195.1 hypothetical protein FB458_2303 [Lapillicoccus jejuensis]
MQRSWPNTVRRTVRRVTTWRPKHAGDATLDVSDLIRPYRYDVIVRASLFDRIDAERPTTDDLPDFAAQLRDHPYATWFREVELRRFFPWVLQDEAEVERMFVRRVGKALAVFTSVERHGFDADRPLTLRRVSLPAVTDSGLPVAHMLHVGDGGHRLALLLRSGVSLAPNMYRVDPRPHQVIDNTALLAPALGLTEEDWATFVGPHFVRTPVTGVDDLLQAVAAECPMRLEEVEQLSRTHLPARSRL